MSAYNGSGTFVISGTGLPFVTATTISSTVANQLNTDLASGLSTAICKDGQTTTTAAIPFALGIQTDTIVPVTANSGISISGTATNNSAAAGKVGEYIISNVASGSAISLTTATPANVTSISLTAGDWDVGASIGFIGASTTTVTYFVGSISSTTGALSTTRGDQVLAGSTPFNYLASVSTTVPTTRFSLSGSQTVYLVAQSGFTVSSNAAFGYIWARRAR
jgi:uncharacterized membrane protein